MVNINLKHIGNYDNFKNLKFVINISAKQIDIYKYIYYRFLNDRTIYKRYCYRCNS